MKYLNELWKGAFTELKMALAIRQTLLKDIQLAAQKSTTFFTYLKNTQATVFASVANKGLKK